MNWLPGEAAGLSPRKSSGSRRPASGHLAHENDSSEVTGVVDRGRLQQGGFDPVWSFYVGARNG